MQYLNTPEKVAFFFKTFCKTSALSEVCLGHIMRCLRDVDPVSEDWMNLIEMLIEKCNLNLDDVLMSATTGLGWTGSKLRLFHTLVEHGANPFARLKTYHQQSILSAGFIDPLCKDWITFVVDTYDPKTVLDHLSTIMTPQQYVDITITLMCHYTHFSESLKDKLVSVWLPELYSRHPAIFYNHQVMLFHNARSVCPELARMFLEYAAALDRVHPDVEEIEDM